MNPIEAIASVYRNYAKTDGRARASEYWWFVLAEFLFINVMVIGSLLLDEVISPWPDGDGYFWGGMIILGVVALGSLVPRIAVTVRRIQDAGNSGSFFWLILIPSVGGLIVLVLTLLPGTRGPNQYGPDPRDPAGAWTAIPPVPPTPPVPLRP